MASKALQVAASIVSLLVLLLEFSAAVKLAIIGRLILVAGYALLAVAFDVQQVFIRKQPWFAIAALHWIALTPPLPDRARKLHLRLMSYLYVLQEGLAVL